MSETQGPHDLKRRDEYRDALPEPAGKCKCGWCRLSQEAKTIRAELGTRGAALIDHLMDWNCYAEEDAAYYRARSMACRNLHGGLPEDWWDHANERKEASGE